jgi:hypothetical protein
MRQPLGMPVPTAEESERLDTPYRTTRGAAAESSARHNRAPHKTLSIIGSNAATAV